MDAGRRYEDLQLYLSDGKTKVPFHGILTFTPADTVDLYADDWWKLESIPREFEIKLDGKITNRARNVMLGWPKKNSARPRTRLMRRLRAERKKRWNRALYRETEQ